MPVPKSEWQGFNWFTMHHQTNKFNTLLVIISDQTCWKNKETCNSPILNRKQLLLTVLFHEQNFFVNQKQTLCPKNESIWIHREFLQHFFCVCVFFWKLEILSYKVLIHQATTHLISLYMWYTLKLACPWFSMLGKVNAMPHLYRQQKKS